MSAILKFEDYTVTWIAVLPIEAEAALGMLDKQHLGQFESVRGDDYIYIGGEINGHNVVVATWPEGQNYGVGSAAALVNQVKARFPNIWFALLVGVAAGLPNLNPHPPIKARDIRLGDVLVCEPEKSSSGIIHYDLGKDTADGFLLNGRLAETPAIVRSAIGNIKLTKKKPFRKGNLFSDYLLKFQQAMEDDKFLCRDQQEDRLFTHLAGSEPVLVQREPRDESERTQVWYGNIGSGNSMMRNPQRRDELRDKYDLIGLEMEASGIMNTLPTGVIRGVCDYGDDQKNKDWQPYAAATAASYAKGVLYAIRPRSIKPSTVTERHWIVPFGRNKKFVGRETELQYLMENLNPEDENDCQRVAIAGLGGIGKTQIALEAAFKIKETFSDCSVFWVPAVDKASFERAYREIGHKLKIPNTNDNNADSKPLVKEFLSQKNIGRWLMIIDNADDLEMFFDRAGKNNESFSSTPLVDYLPFSQRGSILFTTRNSKVAVKYADTNFVVVKDMSQNESQELFEANLVDKSLAGDKEEVLKLLDQLSNFPLAIKQAAAFLNENSMSLSEYLEIYRSSNEELIELLSEDFEDKGRYPNIKNPVASTWLISFQHIERSDTLAAEYLYFMSCVAQHDIPRSLLPSASKLREGKAIGTLIAYGFVTERDGCRSYDIHRLVQLAARNWLKKENKLSSWTFKVLELVADAFPFCTYEKRDECALLLPHIQYVLAFLRDFGDSGRSSRHLLHRVGAYFLQTGEHLEAEKFCRQAFELNEEVLSLKHPETLYSMHNLALVLYGQGKYKEAETLNRQALKIREEVLGPKHPETLSSINNLALVLQSQRKYEEAETLHQHLIKIKDEVLGPKHPDTLSSLNHLALLLNSQGKYEVAETLHRQVLKIKREILGSDHPDTIGSINNLAFILNHKGKYKEAEILLQQVLEVKGETLRLDLPSKLSSMNNLAQLLDSQGKYKEAETLHRQTVEIKGEALGPKHQDTIHSISNLASVLCSQGEYEEAKTLYQQALKIRVEVLGAKHPDTLHSINNLASVLYSQGKYEEAETLYGQALEIRMEVLDNNHPDILDSINNLALVLYGQEKYKDARTLVLYALGMNEEVIQQMLEMKEEVLRLGHASKLGSIIKIALLLDSQRKDEETENIRQRNTEDSTVTVDENVVEENKDASSADPLETAMSLPLAPPDPNQKPVDLGISQRRLPPEKPLKPPHLKGSSGLQ